MIHDMAIITGRIFGSNPLTRGVLSLLYKRTHSPLEQTLYGIRFPNAVGLAAGFDKDCHLMHVLHTLDFGFEEVGSITAQAYGGNPGKRLVRLKKDKGIIVYYGLKNEGAQALKKRIKRPYAIPLGVSVAKTNKAFKNTQEGLDDWMRVIRTMKSTGDYLTLNLSCPNVTTPEDYCDPKMIEQLFSRIKKKNIRFTKPVLLKLAWHITPERMNKIIKLCDKAGFVKGFILTNLSKERSKLAIKTPKSVWEHQPGGISGPLIKENALALVRHTYKKAGDRYLIIGCGGIFSADDAYEYIKNGASLLQLITGMIYEGPGLIKRINKGLEKKLTEDGYTHISQAIGSGVK